MAKLGLTFGKDYDLCLSDFTNCSAISFNHLQKIMFHRSPDYIGYGYDTMSVIWPGPVYESWHRPATIPHRMVLFGAMNGIVEELHDDT